MRNRIVFLVLALVVCLTSGYVYGALEKTCSSTINANCAGCTQPDPTLPLWIQWYNQGYHTCIPGVGGCNTIYMTCTGDKWTEINCTGNTTGQATKSVLTCY